MDTSDNIREAIEDKKSAMINRIMARFGLSYKRAELIYEQNKDNGFFEEPWFKITEGNK